MITNRRDAETQRNQKLWGASDKSGSGMKQELSKWWRVGLLVSFSAVTLFMLTGSATTQSTGDPASALPTFLRANRCYRFTFPIAGAPNWKVLELLDAGWIKAEVDAGPRSAVREPAWINTAQIITVREAVCSE